MRRYKKEIKTRYGTQTVLNDGLKQVHIGDDVWVYGRQKYVENPDKSVTYPKRIATSVGIVGVMLIDKVTEQYNQKLKYTYLQQF